MPAPLPTPRPWSTTMIIIGIFSAIIIFTFVAFFVYIRRRRRNTPSHNISDPEARRLSQVTGDSERSNSQVETNSNRTQIGFKVVGRLPRLETNTPVRSVHPSVHNASPARSNFEPPLPTLSRRRSDPEERINTQVALEGRRTYFFEKDWRGRKHFAGQSLDSRIKQYPSLEPPTIIELPRASLESNEQTDKHNQSFYSPLNEQGSSMRSLLEMSPTKFDAFPSCADLPMGFKLPATNSLISQPPAIDRAADFRITPSSIVETTEKKPPARILRKKLLNLISTQPRPGLRNESEDKYYWEMMQVETNETWWQLPFPPPLSPIKPEFELSDLDFQPRSDSPAGIDHPGNAYDPHPQGIELASL